MTTDDDPAVVVVGAGVVGASIAWHTARAGARVVLLDAATAAATDVTGASFAWIGGPSGTDVADGSSPLRASVIDDHRRLEREVPGIRVHWCGSLAWGRQRFPDAGELGPDEELVDDQAIRRLEPRLRQPPPQALHRPTDGAVDPVAVTVALVGAARDRGAEVRFGTAVTGVRVRDGAVVGVETSRGFVAAGTVVLAAGTGVPALCTPLGVDVPVDSSPALLVRFSGPAGLVRTVLAAPDVEVRQHPDGRLLAAAEHTGEATEEELHETGQAVLGRVRRLLDGADGVRLVDVRLGRRPMPADGLPIIGRVGRPAGLYLAVMHAGVTLAPVVGRLAAVELVEGVRLPELDGVSASSLGDAGGPPTRSRTVRAAPGASPAHGSGCEQRPPPPAPAAREST